MDKDPFLAAHQRGPGIFDLTGRFSPISIRDQLIRARFFVDRALQEGLFSRHGCILIVGAGLAGVAVSMRAAELGVASVIVESSDRPFGRFADCTSRWLDPTQYDWPADHWNSSLLPDVPLPFPPAFANELVAKWNAKFQERAKDNQLIKLYRNVNYPVDIDSLDPVDAFVSVVGNTAWECDLVVYCIGVGSENCTAGEYRGPAFWERDDLESPDLGIEGDSARLVISGAGDGALQDLIRAATGAKSVSELMREITREGGEEELRNAIYSGEDRAQRCLLWSSHSWHDHEVLTALEQAYLTIVDEVDGGEAGTVWRSICSKLDSILIARNGDRRTIHLIHSCHHFSRCFGLNRFLAQLTMRRLSRFYPDRFKILTNSAITNVRCNHEKSPSGTCWGKPHTVTFNRQSCGTAAYGDNEEIPSNALILRHGIRFGREDQRSRAARQHLPYGIPY